VGRVTDGQENPGGSSPHYEILVDAAGTPYRVAVNVKSVQGSEVLAFFDPSYTNDTKLGLAALAAGPHGFTALQTGNVYKGLDYVRDALFPPGPNAVNSGRRQRRHFVLAAGRTNRARETRLAGRGHRRRRQI
jgi:hypothetical protein